jgi:hypothetical protein
LSAKVERQLGANIMEAGHSPEETDTKIRELKEAGILLGW